MCACVSMISSRSIVPPPHHGHIYDNWRQRIVSGLVAYVAEVLHLSVGHEFGR